MYLLPSAQWRRCQPASSDQEQRDDSLLEVMDAIPGGEEMEFYVPKLTLTTRTVRFEQGEY